MDAFVTCWDGRAYRLPEMLEWEFSYGLGEPCDGFVMTCAWEPGAEKLMADAIRLRAEQDGSIVFTGIVDEYRCVRDRSGSKMELSGRGLQGLLLDNEAMPVEYQVATLQDILREHVEPYDIEVKGGEELQAVAGFAVTGGRSEWSVLHDFARYHNGVLPRFDREGRLVLSKWADGEAIRIWDDVPLTRLVYTESRYGVLSQVVVRDRARDAVEIVRDEAFLAQGGMCRRVITTGERSTAVAMRSTADYQLRASRENRMTCELTVPMAFYAFPGDLIRLGRTDFGANGLYRVREAVTGMNGNGVYTELHLGETEQTA